MDDSGHEKTLYAAKEGRNVPKTRNETRPSGASGPLTVFRRSPQSRFLAAHTADELECDAPGRALLGLRGGRVLWPCSRRASMLPRSARLSATVAGARQAAQPGLEWGYQGCHRMQASGRKALAQAIVCHDQPSKKEGTMAVTLHHLIIPAKDKRPSGPALRRDLRPHGEAF